MFDFLSGFGGCSGSHHFEVESEKEKFKVKYITLMSGKRLMKVYQRVEKRCAHEGCYETKADYRYVGKVNRGDGFPIEPEDILDAVDDE